MKKSTFSEAQIATALRQVDAGAPVVEISRAFSRHSIVGMAIGREFGDSWVNASHYSGREFKEWMNARLNRLDSILERLDLFPLESAPVENSTVPHEETNCNKNEIFIVHGHDEGLVHKVARFI